MRVLRFLNLHGLNSFTLSLVLRQRVLQGGQTDQRFNSIC